ncbi:DUF4362 domain-containing protein [Paenibacillus sp. NPDC057967]|uniref:DUF4362 domain-containing protein n=1 Tax=Paenibacillus sp. NPDC057967 TaxID=3346293 RepID=UPI0036DBEE95
MRKTTVFIFISLLLMSCSSSKDPYHELRKSTILVDALGTKNTKRIDQFMTAMSQQKSDEIGIVHYTVEGAPIVQELAFEGGDYIRYSYDNSRDKYGADYSASTTCRSLEIRQSVEEDIHISNYVLTGCDEIIGASVGDVIYVLTLRN